MGKVYFDGNRLHYAPYRPLDFLDLPIQDGKIVRVYWEYGELVVNTEHADFRVTMVGSSDMTVVKERQLP
jgi:formylmethanofuran dehydrogenase subunit D